MFLCFFAINFSFKTFKIVITIFLQSMKFILLWNSLNISRNLEKVKSFVKSDFYILKTSTWDILLRLWALRSQYPFFRVATYSNAIWREKME